MQHVCCQLSAGGEAAALVSARASVLPGTTRPPPRSSFSRHCSLATPGIFHSFRNNETKLMKPEVSMFGFLEAPPPKRPSKSPLEIWKLRPSLASSILASFRSLSLRRSWSFHELTNFVKLLYFWCFQPQTWRK